MLIKYLLEEKVYTSLIGYPLLCKGILCKTIVYRYILYERVELLYSFKPLLFVKDKSDLLVC